VTRAVRQEGKPYVVDRVEDIVVGFAVSLVTGNLTR
jgi:hypothetical protein